MSVSPSGNCSTVTVSDDGSAVVASCAAVINQTGGGGGVSDGDKGDITVSGSGSTWTIDAGVVGTAKIADSAVTYAKLQPTSAAARLLGRPGGTGSTAGTVSEISVGNGLKFDGASLVVSNTDVVSTSTQIIAGTGLTGGTQTLAGNVNLGVDFATSGTSSATKVVRADDLRLSNARTPTAHALSHAVGQSDAISPADIGAADSIHTHAASAITSGTIGIARGGTNLGTTPSNGQLLIGNGTGYTLATLTQGSGVTITNAAGAITIASTGGSGSVATDTIWAAKGDLAVATGNDAAAVLTVGANGTMLVADSNETTGARWGAVEIPTKAFTAGTNNTTTPGLYQTVRYTATTTGITVPSGATFMMVVGAGGGGGGGGGQAMATSGASFAGGAGGQGGQGWLHIFRLSDLSSPSTIQVTIGAGGSGGTGGATAATSNNGTAGGAGGATLLETSGGTLIARFTGGEGGGGGAGANAIGGSTASHLGWSGGLGGRGGRQTTSALAGSNNYYGGGGGGGGNGATTTNSVTVCGDGGASGYFDGRTALEAATQTNSQGTARPTTAATNGTAGSAGSGLFGGNGGSGATGSRATTAGNAGDGGAGGAGGGGGGGGGGRQEYTTADGSRAGNGGAGGDGFLSLRFW